MKRVQRELNDRPRAVLRWKKPIEVINHLVALKFETKQRIHLRFFRACGLASGRTSLPTRHERQCRTGS